MSRLPFADYLRHLESESARFRAVLEAADPSAHVPGCPDWDAADLLWHLAEVQWFWGSIVLSRPAGPEHEFAEPDRPDTYADMLAAFDEQSQRLVRALRDADPADPAWTWSTEHTVGFIYRRQAHEALIHRLDAEQTAGAVTALDPRLASDGVDEVLAVMIGGCPPWGTFTPDGHGVRVRIEDTGVEVLATLGRFAGTDPEDGTAYDDDDIGVVDQLASEPVVTVSGSAGDLDTWLWRRGGPERIRIEGDPEAVARFRAIANQPIN
jgi:uncharacterized protein (TIGR03083 family)